MSVVSLSDGFKIPRIGFGTYKLNGFSGAQAISSALTVGYRLIDTAYNYQNEGTVGRGIKASMVPRNELFIQSKLPGKYYADEQATIALVQESLYRTGLDYFDLYLLHWPNPIDDHYLTAWQTLIQLQKFGLVKSIGVSNFLPEHIERLQRETGVLPVVNQIELHPYFNQKAMIQYNTEKKILTQAWSPLGRASRLLKDNLLLELAEKYHKNVGQIILRWETQQGVVPIPKAVSYTRQVGNLNVFDFELESAEMLAIDRLSKKDGRTNNQDPAVYQGF
ncbi:2,5-diketo-D-gluconic acid reductase [Leuconostoc citreum]|uniref:aldo/keto reductase n=1 Tax=Leuconostoc citreum TaxID=33964 RepID=UPI0011241803|nr:aldo/keto reductase [Leuconostoc citreum]TOY70367.1 2,5-diketo-D-gluconic acid reductase [Leuconostoc citreum]